MGGTAGRSTVALSVAAVLLASTSGAILATEGCDSSAANGTPAAPTGQAALTLDVTWDSSDEVLVEYWAVPSGGDGYPAPPDWTGGCTDDAWGVCPPAYPLILTEPAIPGYNTTDRASAYTLMAMVRGACVYPKADSQPDNERVTGVYDSISEVPVTATITDREADGSVRSEATMAAVLPMPPDAGIADYSIWWRALGTFDWDPTTGLKDAQPTKEHPDDLVVEDTDSALEALAQPDPVSEPDETIAPGAFAPSTTPSPVERVEVALRWISRLGPATRGHEAAIGSAWQWVLFAAVQAFVAAEARGQDTAELEGAIRALVLFVLLRDREPERFDEIEPVPDDSAAGATAAPEPPPSGPPPDPPPKMGKRAKQEQRRWVWLPAAALIYQTYPNVTKKKLETATWYQMKVNDDGSRDFYNRKGRWIGTNPIDEREAVTVRRRGDTGSE